MRAAEAARALARWEGGEPAARRHRRRRTGSRRSRRATARSRPAVPAAPKETAVVQALYTRPFLTYGSIGPSCALAEFKDGALKVWSHCQGPAVLRDWLATRARTANAHRSPCSTARAPAPTATTPPTMPPSTRPSSPCGCRAAPCACSGRARTSSPPRRSAPPWRSSSRAVLDDDNTPGRLDDRDLEPAARPASRHERQLQPRRRRGVAERAAAQRAQRRSGRARRRRDAQRATPSTTCRATG